MSESLINNDQHCNPQDVPRVCLSLGQGRVGDFKFSVLPSQRLCGHVTSVPLSPLCAQHTSRALCTWPRPLDQWDVKQRYHFEVV